MPDPLNNSYYAASANAWTTQPNLVGDLHCDIVVVGGGFTGLSTALACAEKGLSVALFEAETIGFGASGRNGGQLIPGLRWSMRELDTKFGRERARAIHDLAWSAVARVKERITQHNIKCDLKPGHLEAAFKPAHFDDMNREAEFLSENFGWDSIQVVQPAQMGLHINGGGYHGGVYDPQGGHFHPLNYAFGLAVAARNAGVQIFENTRAAGYHDLGHGGVEVFAGSADTKSKGGVRAKHLVVATDAWIGDIAPDLGAYTVPIMNYNIATAPLGNADELLPSDAAVADSRFVLNYFRLSADKRMIFGGGEKYVQTPPADISAFVSKHMVQVFPSLADARIDYAWGGAVAVTSNRLPDMGRNGNVFYAHGFSGHGALITTLAGELLAEAVVGTMGRFDILASLPHTRFPGGKWLARPLATLGLMWFALRDRL
jgi:gamma-glutamylputrescine oxidase